MDRLHKFVVWLGNGCDRSDIAMEFLRRLGGDETLHLNPFQELSVSVDGLNLHSVELWRHFMRLFDVPLVEASMNSSRIHPRRKFDLPMFRKHFNSGTNV